MAASGPNFGTDPVGFGARVWQGEQFLWRAGFLPRGNDKTVRNQKHVIHNLFNDEGVEWSGVEWSGVEWSGVSERVSE